ncbi:MAG: PA14 domain-containing protein [Kiritimatiellae bacterium]|nr:PA14 domain-containing protein [Kiritimatiellia bacterium]
MQSSIVERVIFLAAAATGGMVSGTRGAPPVLTWDPSAGGTVWNTTASNWLDDASAVQPWQQGAEAAFTNTPGGLVEIGADLSAATLTFTGSGHDLSGAGVLSVVSNLFSAASCTNRIDAALRAVSAAGVAKTGAGTLTLGHPNITLTRPVTVAGGTLALENVTLAAPVTVAGGATFAVRQAATNGLTGYYYDLSTTGSVFSTLATLEAHFSRLTPALAVPSGLAGETFDFGTAGERFPLPYGSAGTRTNHFQVYYRGQITVPATDYYTFRIEHDDGILLALDRKMVAMRQANTTTETTVLLHEGPHDMALGYFQGTGGCRLRVQVKTLYGTFMMLPQTWLTPYSTVPQLSGDGSLALDAGSALNLKQSGSGAFSGRWSGPAGAVFGKTDRYNLALTSAHTASNGFAGGMAVYSGSLAIDAPERVADSTTLTLADETALRVNADETLGALSGAGSVVFGGSPTVHVYPFSDAANCGLSSAKTYTHLLDFPDNGGPATVNGVTFTSAGMSGSANGYAWNTVNPPNGKWTDGATNGIDQLLYDFAYGSLDYTVTLSGLTPGKSYESRLYFRSFGSPNPTGTRNVSFVFTAGGRFIGSTDHIIDSAARSIVSCRYTADEAGTCSIRVLSHHAVDTCHLYALTNEEAPPPVPPADSPSWAPSVAAFTDDADSGLSPLKSYTHLLDFPANGYPAIINGVAFTAAAMNGSANGYAWSCVNPPPSAWNGSPTDSTREGVDRLLWDFFYNSTDFTLTLSGLYPGETYETRLYFRSFGTPVANSSRDITCAFTAGAVDLGSVPHDLDTLARSMVRCRYTADSAGTIAVRVVSVNSGSSCHLYALSNERVPRPGSNGPTLTLNTPQDRAAHLCGAIAGTGALVKRGAGTQRLGGDVNLPLPVDVQAGMLALTAGAAVRSGVVVRAGATLETSNGDVRLGGLEGSGTFRLGGLAPFPVTNLLRTVYFTDDAGTGIAASNRYTHLLDFGTRSVAAVINGVAFNKVQSSNGSIQNYGWGNFPPQAHPGTAANAPVNVPAGSGVYDLLYDMNYGWSWPDPATMQLHGLVPGKRYEVRLYNRSWGQTLGGSRTQTLTFDPDGSGPISESVTFNADNMLPHYISCRYTAVSSTLDIIVQSAQSNQTYHLYGLSNEELSDAVYAPVVLDLTRDCAFAGAVTGAGGWVKDGPGTLTFSGPVTATGPLALQAGVLACTGLGGGVSVASNAWLRAGAAMSCGTLDVGGTLAFAPGTRLPWRYSAEAADLYTAAASVFPTNGTLQLAPLAGGLKPPAWRPLVIAQTPINGPADLSGWVIEGAPKAELLYSADRTAIYFSAPRGTLLLLN